MVLHPIPESVGRARRWYRKFTEPYELMCSGYDCVLMLSELVTNAVLYGAVDEPWLVRVRWYRVGDALRVDVHNSGCPAHVRMRSPDVTEAHGRGLLLVDELADEWWSGPSAYGGTVVVFVMRQAFKPRQPGL
ncbi:ATP-binding protein [Streptomyces sp. p1417]|uniref:ATP-binding protein n=2 Tax=Streptomyces typhae TaxID=2681492 RepID=A0A6L6WSX8_9ACTN|nr:ATP-binding protein [Streptomyces typhae]